MDIVGLIPATGAASRLSPIPCSKEILPVGIEEWGGGSGRKPKVAIHYVLESMRKANITKAYIIIRNNKWDIPAYLGDGKEFGLDIAYLMMGLPYGPPFSVNQAYPFISSSIIALGYPDIIFQPNSVYNILLEKMKTEKADVVLGLFPAVNPQKMDMIEFDANENISRIVIKPQKTDLQYTYINAVWSPRFNHFFNKKLSSISQSTELDDKTEYYLGEIFQEFMNAGNKIGFAKINKGTYFDIGTIEDYQGAVLNHIRSH